MGIETMHPRDFGAKSLTGSAGVPRRVLALYEEGRRGAAVLREAAELSAAGAELAVVTLAPQAKPLRCCGGGGAGPYNCAVRDAAEEELVEARSVLGSLAGRASFTRLVGTPTPPLAAWAGRQPFDLILLPGRRFGRGGGPLARELRAATGAEIRFIR
jgi:hypothetical protein